MHERLVSPVSLYGAGCKCEAIAHRAHQGRTQACGGAGAERDWQNAKWAAEAVLPKIEDANAAILPTAMELQEPVPLVARRTAKHVDDDGDDDDDDVDKGSLSRYTVTASKDQRQKFQVDLEAFKRKSYATACTCGMTSSSWVCCQHTAHKSLVARFRHTHIQRIARVATPATIAPDSRIALAVGLQAFQAMPTLRQEALA